MTIKKAAILAAGLAGSLAFSLSAQAGVSESEASRLGKDLTPVGAERAGNAEGTIPEWTGGLSSIPAGVSFSEGDHHPDPFAGDPIQFTITDAMLVSMRINFQTGKKLS